MSEWENLDDSDGEASGFFRDLGAAWQAELDDYGVDEAFDAPQTAALDGWDYPPLKRVLQGTITEQGAWDGEPP